MGAAAASILRDTSTGLLSSDMVQSSLSLYACTTERTSAVHTVGRCRSRKFIGQDSKFWDRFEVSHVDSVSTRWSMPPKCRSGTVANSRSRQAAHSRCSTCDALSKRVGAARHAMYRPASATGSVCTCGPDPFHQITRMAPELPAVLYLPWQFLNLRPLPQGQCSLRPTLGRP